MFRQSQEISDTYAPYIAMFKSHTHPANSVKWPHEPGALNLLPQNEHGLVSFRSVDCCSDAGIPGKSSLPTRIPNKRWVAGAGVGHPRIVF
jgi:hypothetical protein